jgi:hypothetical protein
VTCSGGGAWRVAQVLLAALAAGVAAAWLLPRILPVAVVAAVATGLAWHFTKPHATLLRWDGAVWSADGQTGQVDLMLDLQRWLLLRFRPAQGRALWLPLPDAEAGAARHALRTALYAHAGRSGAADV